MIFDEKMGDYYCSGGYCCSWDGLARQEKGKVNQRICLEWRVNKISKKMSIFFSMANEVI